MTAKQHENIAKGIRNIRQLALIASLWQFKSSVLGGGSFSQKDLRND